MSLNRVCLCALLAFFLVGVLAPPALAEDHCVVAGEPGSHFGWQAIKATVISIQAEGNHYKIRIQAATRVIDAVTASPNPLVPPRTYDDLVTEIKAGYVLDFWGDFGGPEDIINRFVIRCWQTRAVYN